MNECPRCFCPVVCGSCTNINCGWEAPRSDAGRRRRRRAEARRRRDDGIGRAELGAAVDWLLEAERVGAQLAATRQTFTTDSIWDALDASGVRTGEHRAMGAVMRRLAQRGLIENTHQVVPSERPECHRRPVTVWRSRG